MWNEIVNILKEDNKERLCICKNCVNQEDNDCNEPKSKHYGENVDGLVVCCPYYLLEHTD